MFGPSGPTLTTAERRRYAADRDVLAALMPRVDHLICADGTAMAEGPVELAAGAGTVAEVEISMRFDHLYPDAPPAVYDRRRRWRPTVDRHMYPDYQFCLALPGVDRIDVSTPARFAVFLDRLAVYLTFQLIFDASGQWPGKEWRHGLAAYAQHAIETLQLESPELFERLWPQVAADIAGRNDPCPCGRDRKFKQCHEQAVRRLRALRRLPDFTEIEALVQQEVDNRA
jgi:SEC-C motif